MKNSKLSEFMDSLSIEQQRAFEDFVKDQAVKQAHRAGSLTALDIIELTDAIEDVRRTAVDLAINSADIGLKMKAQNDEKVSAMCKEQTNMCKQFSELLHKELERSKEMLKNV